MIMILLGAPGSGKGSISNYLREKYGFIHISTGDLFRKTLASGTEFGNKVKAIIQSGKLVDDSITNEMISQELAKLDLSKENIILDGYPRNLNQLEHLKTITKIDYAIDVQVDKDEIIKRITGRRTCPVCKEIYNIYYKKPLVDGKCDHDGADLMQRSDDQESVVVERYKTYMSLNAPLVAACEELKILHAVKNDSFENAVNEVKKICNLK